MYGKFEAMKALWDLPSKPSAVAIRHAIISSIQMLTFVRFHMMVDHRSIDMSLQFPDVTMVRARSIQPSLNHGVFKVSCSSSSSTSSSKVEEKGKRRSREE